jgi:hypothetical protein
MVISIFWETASEDGDSRAIIGSLKIFIGMKTAKV